MDFRNLATRVASRNIEARRRAKPVPKRQRKVSKPAKPSRDQLLSPETEYSCQVEISLSADFEGNVARQQLIRKLKSEIVAAIKAGVTTVAREFRIQATGVLVKPLKVEIAVNDQSSIEDDADSFD